jgi:hypothetical protein
LSEEIDKVRESEERRGKRRRPLNDPQATDRKQRRLAAAREILFGEGATIEDLEEAMIGRGISPDSPQWIELSTMWRNERKKRGLPV